MLPGLLSRLGGQPVWVSGGWVELGEAIGDAGHSLELPGGEHGHQLLLQGRDVTAATGFTQPGSDVPVAGVDVGDIAAMVAAENRPFIVPRDDEVALADAMAKLLVTPARARAIGAANQARARDAFDQDAMFAAYDRLYRGTAL